MFRQRHGLDGLIVLSKVYGIMAVGRAFIAAIEESSDAAEIVRQHRCGLRVDPDSREALKNAILWSRDHRDELDAMGQRGRQAAVRLFDRAISTGKFASIIESLHAEGRPVSRLFRNVLL